MADLVLFFILISFMILCILASISEFIAKHKGKYNAMPYLPLLVAIGIGYLLIKDNPFTDK